MSVPNRPIDPAMAPRVAMMITGAMIGGCLFFIIVAVAMTGLQLEALQAGPLTLLGLGIAVVATGLAVFLPGIIARSAMQRARMDGIRDPASEAAQRIASSTALNQVIIRNAILEGGALFCAMVAIPEKSWLALGASLFLLAAMLVFFPWPGRFESARDSLRNELR